jgi:glycosyltransferase involved in cell wall biosynthesis
MTTQNVPESSSAPSGSASRSPATRHGTLLLISQVYIPDPASVGQHMADVAAELVKRGWRVVVMAAAAGYDDPSIKYKSEEIIDGVEIWRFPLSSFGKSSLAMRLLAQMIFMVQCMFWGLFVGKMRGIIVSTSPPFAAVAAMFIRAVRRVPIKYWVMDLNPDQMIALGKTSETSIAARVFNFLNRMILKRADEVVVLDRFMAERVNRKRDVSSKMTILPPWPHEDHLEIVPHEKNPFREKHNLQGKTVIMYSGNHGFSTPVTTVLQAALKLQDRDDIVFMFIGGGVGKKEVEQIIAEHQPKNIRSLPYQPLDQIKYSLSAADVHVVTVGDTVVGIVHPCKIYGAMALARPILLVAPDPCHASDLVSQNQIGWHIGHGEVDKAVEIIQQIAATPPEHLEEMGRRGANVVRERLNMPVLCGAVCDIFERGLFNRNSQIAIQKSSPSHGEIRLHPE